MGKNNDMEETIQTIKGELEEMRIENTSLKRKIGGYQTSHENYRKQVAELKERVEHYKKLDLEGDRLYEEKIAECDFWKKQIEAFSSQKADTAPLAKVAELEQTIETKNSIIESLKEKLQSVMIEKSELEGKVVSLTEEQVELYDTIEELQKPWWKRIFD